MKRWAIKYSEGFTLVELLLVIAIIAILAAIIFVALNPLKRFQDARDARRYSEVHAIMMAIKMHQVDNGGYYLPVVSSAVAGRVYMIVDGTMATGCDDNNVNCDTPVNNDTACLDLSGLVTAGYLGDVPVSPAGAVSWDHGASDGQEGTGYTLERDSNNILFIRSCESESLNEIMVMQ